MTIGGQLPRFLVVGSLTVVVDLITYIVLLRVISSVDLAKGTSFIAGTVFSYLANRHWTFSARGGWLRILKFVALYLATLVINTSINQLMLSVTLRWDLRFSIGFAFLIATGTSAAVNFIGMKYFVFEADEVRSS